MSFCGANLSLPNGENLQFPLNNNMPLQKSQVLTLQLPITPTGLFSETKH